MFNDFWIPMIYHGTLTKPWLKVYELEGRILAQGVHLKKVLKFAYFFEKQRHSIALATSSVGISG